MPLTRISAEALAEARRVVTQPDLFNRLFPEDAADLRQTAWDMLKEDHAARRKARRFPFHHTGPRNSGDAA